MKAALPLYCMRRSRRPLPNEATPGRPMGPPRPAKLPPRPPPGPPPPRPPNPPANPPPGIPPPPPPPRHAAAPAARTADSAHGATGAVTACDVHAVHAAGAAAHTVRAAARTAEPIVALRHIQPAADAATDQQRRVGAVAQVGQFIRRHPHVRRRQIARGVHVDPLVAVGAVLPASPLRAACG